MIWIIVAFLTGLAVMSVLVPLSRRRAPRSGEAAARAFYDSQLAEVDRDLERGLIGAAEAEVARAEASRRLIASHESAQRGPAASRSLRRAGAIVAIVLIPAVGLGLYRQIGNPDLADRPLVARKTAPAGGNDIYAAISKIEQHLAKNPDDARGWEVIAPVYLRMGRAGEAAKAWANVIRIAGPSSQRYTMLGEAFVFANEGKVSPEALGAFRKALELEPNAPQPQFFFGLAAEQSGDKDKARAIWTKLLAAAPANASWAEPVRQKIAALGPQVKVPAPDELVARSITALPKDEQQAAIRGMVDRLARRLQENGKDAEGWLMLVNAYAAMKENEKAREALADARKALAGEDAALDKLTALARQLGLEG